MKNSKQDAALYLLTCLLQRLELKSPGLVDELMDGVKADSSSVLKDASDYEYVQSIFSEAEAVLSRLKSVKK